MFNNLFNIHDILKILEKIKDGQIKPALRKIFSNKNKRTADSWKHIQSPPVNWENIPAVKERLHKLSSGSAAVNQREYIRQTYLQGRKELTALSPGCGVGQNEIAWAEMGIFKQIDAFDISQNRIKQAIKAAAQKGFEKILRFSTADAQKVDLSNSRYDLILFEGSLHHFYPVKEILQRANSHLKPDGYLVVYDFVGPSRFQWTRQQLKITNALLEILPQRYKKKWPASTIKKRVHRPGRLLMILNDPSEAADSANILPCLQEIFKVLEIKEIGGTILHLLFNGIAHNFREDDPETRAWLQTCFKVEDILLGVKAISSDFILAICGKK